MLVDNLIALVTACVSVEGNKYVFDIMIREITLDISSNSKLIRDSAMLVIPITLFCIMTVEHGSAQSM